jgi:sugar phosphate isomerase/epimerase
MSNPPQLQSARQNLNDWAPMKSTFSRRDFVCSGALVAAALVAMNDPFALAHEWPPAEVSFPVRLGLASYTFRNFSRAQLIGFMKQLNVFALNAKDVKDHLPADPSEQAVALAEYAAAGIKLHAAGVISFAKEEDADIRGKFEYSKRAGIPVIVAGDPTMQTLPRIEKFAKEYDMRIAIHNHGPEDQLWPSPVTILKAVKDMDPRIGCCIDVGHTVRAGTDVVQAIQEAGPRLFNVHMKDLTNFQDKESQVTVGEGNIPVRKIFEALIAMKYEGFVDLEYEIHANDPMPGVISSFAYMRGILAGLGYASPGRNNK